MNMIKMVLALTVLGCPWLAYAGSETHQYCNEMYPADSYDPEERSLYIQECLEAYGDSGDNEPAVEPAYVEPTYDVEEVTDEPEEVPYYEGTVQEFVEEQPPAETYD